MVTNARNLSVDTVKGFLIGLVIIGHILLGELPNNFIRFWIYSFHMPMFMFVSGYLLDLRKLQQNTFHSLLAHYNQRMLGWWLLAWLIYSTIIISGDFSIHNILRQVVFPYYHLWYVPTLFFFICGIHIFSSLVRVENKLFWPVLFSIGIGMMILNYIKPLPNLCKASFLIYFSLGLYARNLLSNNVKLHKISLRCGGGGSKLYLIYTLCIVIVR